MKQNWSDYLVALGVIACSAVLLLALTFALRGHGSTETGRRTLEIDFPDVTGIRLHSELRYAGAPAGSVTAIRLLTHEERTAATTSGNAVRVTVQLAADVPDIPADARASLGSDTLLSEKFVALSAGTPSAPTLTSGAVLQGLSGATIDDVLLSMGPILKAVNQVLGSIDPIVKQTTETLATLNAGMGDVFPKIRAIATSAQGAAVSAETLLKRTDKLIAENEGGVKSNLMELKTTLAKLQEVLKSANGFVGGTDKEVTARMRELSVVLQNLKVVTTQAKAFTQAIGERPNRVIFGTKPQSLTPESEILRSERAVPALR